MITCATTLTVFFYVSKMKSKRDVEMCGRREGMNICMKSVKGNKEERERGGMDGKGWEQQRNRRRRGKMKRGCAKERVIEMTRSWLKSKWHGRKGGERAEGRKRTNGKEWYINGSWRSKWGKWMSGNGGVEEREWKKCGAEQEEKEEGGGDVRRCEERRGGDLIGGQPSGNVHGLKIGECVM